MDFLKKAVESATSKEEPKEKPSPGPGPEPESQDHHARSTSTTEVLSSAKALADAAQASLKHEAVDKAKVAEAADDLVHAADQYGKLEEKGYGQYVEKAETYVHKYGSGTTEGSTGDKKEPSEGEKSEGGIGDYAKMAQGFMK
ncbi:uncharacterized protein A4U43_C08F13950 [Asparagus officinalis]|uniref:nodulin-related protein 1-like n=1 Tax=Asparagus officinalis TaxID=4686 RepID=UPI00098E2ED0|nr:nodulin-related protein 1-like [Asparagus officinalis]ONK60078.1 uncharacterized protein A4U43_C08F13950 [Asparagus officinalis]